jgi:ATP synthase F1 gamma subunit
MFNAKNLNEEIKLTSGLKSLVETYEAIAVSSMRRIRSSVLENRVFHLGLDRLFQEVKLAYRGELRRFVRFRPKKTFEILLPLKYRQKTALVFLSANTGLYGEIINRTFVLFRKEAEKNPKADLVVIGKMGKALAKKEFTGRKFAYVDFPDTGLALDSLAEITRKLSAYKKVVAFHGVFKNFAEQHPSSSNISGDILLERETSAEKTIYVFEPSLEEVVVFFETEIFASLLEQVFHESRLAKLASRMMLLDHASQNIDKSLKKLSFEGQRLLHLTFNKKQLDAISGLILWDE